MNDERLYVFVISLRGGVSAADELRAVLSGVKGIRAREFTKDDKTFLIHSETDLSGLLSSHGFSFQTKHKGISESFNI